MRHHGLMNAPTVLQALPAAHFAAWLEGAILRYASYLVGSGRAEVAQSLAQAQRVHAELLPEGQGTPGHHLFEIHDASAGPVGSLWLHIGPQGRAHLYDLFIDATHRRRGHAGRALQALFDEARRLGARQLGLNVLAANAGARRLYEQLGFAAHSLQMSRGL